MRITVFFIIAAIGWIAWFASTMAVERRRDLNIVNADYPVCVTSRNGPLLPRPNVKNTHPRRKDMA